MCHQLLAAFFILGLSSMGISAEAKEREVGSCASHQILIIRFDAENNPKFYVGDSIREYAELWRQDASSLDLYLTSNQKILDDIGIEFDPRSKNHLYDMFEINGYVSIPLETRKCLVYSTLALVANEPTIVAGDTKIVIYPKCGNAPFINICIEAVDKSRPMHFQGILPLYGNCFHKACHSIKYFPFCGLACHTVDGIEMVELPCLQDSIFKMTNAKVTFIKAEK